MLYTYHAYSRVLFIYVYRDTTAQRILGLPFWYPNNGEMEFEGWIPNFLGPMAEEMHWIEVSLFVLLS